MADFLTQRDGFWHFARRVPLEYADLDKRGVIRETTKVRVADDPKGVKAGRVARQKNAELEAYWKGLRDGRSHEAQRRYDAARKRARAFGFDYATAAEIAASRPVLEILRRVEVLTTRGVVEDEAEVAAVLGGESPPAIKLSGLFEVYEKIVRAELTDLSPDQLRKWRNPKKRAIANLMAVIGDKELARISRADALDFKEKWQTRILGEELERGTANKDFGQLSTMLRRVEEHHRLGLTPIFADLRIADAGDDSRVPFDPGFVQDRILKDGALASLNAEARAVVYIMVETGLRPSEIVNLGRETMALDADIPHVQVRPDGRRMKTRHSRRDVPLVGVALMAARAHPNGFPRYRDKSALLSATVNKFLAEHDLRPTPDHTLYSLRHTFKDRLRAVEAPEELIDGLMGHKTDKPQYGAGHGLAQKQRWLHKIALTPPSTV